MLYLSVPELIAEAAKLVLAIKDAGITIVTVVFASATVLIYLRTCFRLAETAEGLNGKLQTNEVYFACLEFAPVALAALLYAVWHPGRCIGRRVNVQPGVDDKARPGAAALY